MRLLVIFCFLIVSFTQTASSAKEPCFRAAVFEHVDAGEQLIDPLDPGKNVRRNLQKFRTAIKVAKYEKADIIIFNEMGIVKPSKMKGRPDVSIRVAILPLMEDIPDPGVNPCVDKSFDDRKILQTLSCLSRRNQMYLVANMGDSKKCHPSEKCRNGVRLFNTQVAFDRNGKLVAKYHKFHLYDSPYFDQPQLQEYVFFDTDFGARIGLFVCFDRIFHNPLIPLVEYQNVTTMALSTYFFDEYPVLMSHQIDQAWSRAHKINILSSNAKMLTTGTTGSGIFTPNKVVGYTHDTQQKNKTISSVIVVGSLPVDPKSTSKCPSKKRIINIPDLKFPSQKYNYIPANFSDYVSVGLIRQNDSLQVCDGTFCCYLNYSIESQENLDKDIYHFLAINRTRTFAASDYTAWAETCLVVAFDRERQEYLQKTDVKFSQFSIRGSFSTKYLYPTAVASNFKLIPSQQLIMSHNYLQIKTRKPILSAGIVGRCYDKDSGFL